MFLNRKKQESFKRQEVIIDKVHDDTVLLAIGKLLVNQQQTIQSTNINDYEFKIFSQFGDDGIIQYLINTLNIRHHSFIEFGIEDYSESNTRFLLMNNNWSGFVIDGSVENINRLTNTDYYWRYDLQAIAEFITAENINTIIQKSGMSDIGILSIDIDGNDYFVLKELDLNTINPDILILEYNSVFGPIRKITIPYDPNFRRTEKHYSNLYWGASLPALNSLAEEKGYCLIGSNMAGNNAYFIREDLQNNVLRRRNAEDIWVDSKFRESRNMDNSLSFLRKEQRIEAIKGLPVLNIETGLIEQL